MNCVTCLKPLASCEEPLKQCVTCSPDCQTALLQSQQYVLEARKSYDTLPKKEIREWLYKRCIEPSVTCEKPVPTCSILDLWGGGLFSDYVIDQCSYVKNQSCDVSLCNHTKNVKNQRVFVHLYEIEQDKKMHPALRAYEQEKNHVTVVKNHRTCVHAYCGALDAFCQAARVKNHPFIALDFVWLDYCGTLTEKRINTDFATLKPLTNQLTDIAITVFKGRDLTFGPEQRRLMIDTKVNMFFPSHTRIGKREYTVKKINKKGKEVSVAMGTYLFRVPSKLR